MEPGSLQSIMALAIGFAFGGLVARGYYLVMSEPASFPLLKRQPQSVAFAAVPLLVFAAPFIIMRNTIRSSRMPERQFELVMLATVVAGIWSLMPGTVVVIGLEALGRFVAEPPRSPIVKRRAKFPPALTSIAGI